MPQAASRLQVVVANPPQAPKLLDRVRAAIRARHYGIRTGFGDSSCSTRNVIRPRWAICRSTSFSPTWPWARTWRPV